MYHVGTRILKFGNIRKIKLSNSKCMSSYRISRTKIIPAHVMPVHSYFPMDRTTLHFAKIAAISYGGPIGSYYLLRLLCCDVEAAVRLQCFWSLQALVWLCSASLISLSLGSVHALFHTAHSPGQAQGQPRPGLEICKFENKCLVWGWGLSAAHAPPWRDQLPFGSIFARQPSTICEQQNVPCWDKDLEIRKYTKNKVIKLKMHVILQD